MGFLNRLLTYFTYILGVRNAEPDGPVSTPEPPSEPLKGSHGLLEARALLASENDHVVLVVDHEFLDVPAWVEWDKTRGSVCVAQSTGAVAEIRILVPHDIRILFERVRTILLMARFNGAKVAHRLSLIVHE